MSFESSHKRLMGGGYNKGVAAVLAVLGVLASSGLLSGDAQAWVNVLISAIGAVAVILVPNKEG